MEKIPFSAYDLFAYLASGFLLLFSMDVGLGTYYIFQQTVPIGVLIVIICASYVLGHIIAQFSNVLFEGLFLRRILGASEDCLLKEPKRNIRTFLFRAYYNPLPEKTRGRIANRTREQGIEAVGKALFIHCQEIVKTNQATREQLSVFLNLYSFCRNISMTMLMCSILNLVFHFTSINPITIGTFHVSYLALALVYVFLSIVMFYRFLKFYKSYTKEVFVAYSENR